MILTLACQLNRGFGRCMRYVDVLTVSNKSILPKYGWTILNRFTIPV